MASKKKPPKKPVLQPGDAYRVLNPPAPAPAAAPAAAPATPVAAAPVTPPQNPNLLPGEGANAPTVPTPAPAPAPAGSKANGTREGKAVWWGGKLYTDPYTLAQALGYGGFQYDANQAQQFTNFLVANNLLDWAAYFTPGDAPKLQPGVDGLTKDLGGGRIAIWFGGADGRWYEDPAELEAAIGLHGDQLKAWLSTQPTFAAFFVKAAPTAPGAGKPDGTVENGGIWYKGKLWTDRVALRGSFPSDEEWRGFLNSNPVFLEWWNLDQPTANNAGTSTSPTAPTAGQQVGNTSDYLGIYGLPADVQAEVNRIFANTTDLNQAVTTAMAYIRGTPWYAKTYPGINEGIAKGIISNERDYRSYLNQTNQVYHQFAQRDIGSDEFANFLREGASLSTITGRLQGTSYVKAYGNEAQYLARNFGTGGEGGLSNQELQAYGEQQSGLPSDLGTRIQARLQFAQQRMQRIFDGVLASPSFSLGGQGLFSPSLGGGQKPDIPA